MGGMVGGSPFIMKPSLWCPVYMLYRIKGIIWNADTYICICKYMYNIVLVVERVSYYLEFNMYMYNMQGLLIHVCMMCLILVSRVL